MNQTKIGNRVVVIRRTAPVNEKTGSPQPTERPTTHRIVVIKNGELVESGLVGQRHFLE